MKKFTPDYTNILNAAKNIKPARMPIYEHIISDKLMGKVLNRNFAGLIDGDINDKREYFRNYNNFFKEMGYDTVSFERCITEMLPGGGALGGHKTGIIKNRDDFEKYPWDSIPEMFFERFSLYYELLSEEMPEGMKAIGGPGNGLFECVQDLVGYTNLCYISIDDPELYNDLFKKAGNMMYVIWKMFLERFADVYTVCRFGDDLGFKSTTLISPEDIKSKIIPQYVSIIELIHSYNKPFLLHSCGNIFNVMDDLINTAKIDAKHSNEDQIAPFSVWVQNYGDFIGNFGGIDVDILCRNNEQEIKKYVKDVIDYSIGAKGFALGSGNSIPDYVPVEGYISMIEAAMEARGE